MKTAIEALTKTIVTNGYYDESEEAINHKGVRIVFQPPHTTFYSDGWKVVFKGVGNNAVVVQMEGITEQQFIKLANEG